MTPDPTPGDPRAPDPAVDHNVRWASALLDTLHAHGVRHLCLSPGSRSTPITVQAQARDDLRLHVVLDERGMAFHALGLARALARPVALLTTSGTAVANLHPALQEADAGHTPLIALTADRPPELHGIGDRQVVRQAHRFPEARYSADLGPPDDHGLAHLRATAAHAVNAALGPRPGPVHLNLRFRKPLEPRAGQEAAAADSARTSQAGAPAGPYVHPPHALVGPTGFATLQQHVATAQRPLVLLSAHPRDAAWADAAVSVAQQWGAPLIVDVQSSARASPDAPDDRITLHDGMLASDATRAALAPDLVLQLGARPTSKSLLQLLPQVDTHIILTPDGDHPDPGLTADHVLHGDPEMALDMLDPTAVDPAWHARWQDAQAAAAQALRTDAQDPWEGHVAAAAADATPAGGLLWAGNSMSIRHLERCWPGTDAPGPRVLSHRGANGIDGTLHAALGAAATGAPTTCLLGDVTLVHDLNALEATQRVPQEQRPWTVVLDNGGGAIFRLLPIAEQQDEAAFTEAFSTPPRIDLAAVAAAAGLDVTNAPATDAPELAHVPGGLHLAKDEPSRGIERYKALGEAMAQAALDAVNAKGPSP